jgi:hypothetical protein
MQRGKAAARLTGTDEAAVFAADTRASFFGGAVPQPPLLRFPGDDCKRSLQGEEIAR